MPLDNFANLSASIVNWSKRKDITALVPDFIQLAESEMYSNETSRLRVRSMESRAQLTASTSSRFLALPSDYLEQRRLQIEASNGDIDVKFKPPEGIRAQGASGRPRFFTITDQIEFERVPDSAYTLQMQYYKKLTALDDTNTTNSILTNHPNIYLFGSLWALFEYAEEPDIAQNWYVKFINAIRGANRTDKRGRYGAAPTQSLEAAKP